MCALHFRSDPPRCAHNPGLGCWRGARGDSGHTHTECPNAENSNICQATSRTRVLTHQANWTLNRVEL